MRKNMLLVLLAAFLLWPGIAAAKAEDYATLVWEGGPGQHQLLRYPAKNTIYLDRCRGQAGIGGESGHLR